ncbi:hypothetical protein CcCBS67573_g07411 [Chytriomyces confervae]|uniref:C2H2-type domain-containing protein n=1 Tax=Chytriomyces confervae TaxID=246404 RepID=A0A507EUM4_9FUNG|nr:hypothetical protein HDU80_009106 [Chytriomyces hyalinus]TPX67793.1 hypothetical protein CcCBS67573_g07411 [Chytriomyces confervae]
MSLKRRASLDSHSHLQDATDWEENGHDSDEPWKAPFVAGETASVASRSAGSESGQFGVDLLRMFKCAVEGCSSSFASRDVYLDHKGKRHDNAAVLFMNATRTRVIARDANGLLNCPCGHRGFTYLNGMLKHAKNCTGSIPNTVADPSVASVKAFKCSFDGCLKSYGSKTGLALHLKSKHPNSQTASPMSTSTGSVSAESKASNGEYVSTPESSEAVALHLEQLPESLRKAEEKNQFAPSTPLLTFKCMADRCTQAFASKKGLALHKSKTHGDAIVNFLDSTECTVIRRKNDVLSCPCTDFETASNQEITRHALQCTGSPKLAVILLEAAAMSSNLDSSATPLPSEPANRSVSPAVTLMQSTDTPSFSVDDDVSFSPQRMLRTDSEREEGEQQSLVGGSFEGKNGLLSKQEDVEFGPATKKLRSI